MATLIVKDLTKKYGRFNALNKVSFEVKEGEIVGFLGVNGAGKTTTMRIITGFLFPTAGEVFIKDRSMLDQSLMARRSIGYLPENNPLYGKMQVIQFLNFVREIKQSTKKDLREIMQNLELLDVAKKKIENLSKGYKQRVGLAQAMLGKTDLLVLDEPTSGLDPIQKDNILKYIKSYATDKKGAVLFSSHILSEISEIADRIIIIDKGEIKKQGTPKELESTDVKGEHILVIKAKTTLAKLKTALKSVTSVVEVLLYEEKKINIFHVSIKVTRDRIDAMTEKIATQLSKKGIIVLGLARKEVDIKSVFNKITQS